MLPQPESSRQVGLTADAFKRTFLDNLAYIQGKDTTFATPNDYYLSLAYTMRDQLIQLRWPTHRPD